MIILHPRSLLQLTLFGFGLVALPPIGGLIYTAAHLQHLSAQNQEAVLRTLTTTRTIAALVEKVTDMERVVRQYQVVGELQLLDIYHRNYADFLPITKELFKLFVLESQHQHLNTLINLAEQTYLFLANPRPEAEIIPTAVRNLAELSNLSRALLSDSKSLIEREVTIMKTTAANTQHFLYWQALALGSTALFFAGLFIVLINRPIRQIDNALRRLGNGEFSKPVLKVSGPRDLSELGEKLDWLRCRIVELEEEKTKFLHQVSHELKTPLTALREGTDLLSEGVVGALLPEQLEIASILKKNTINLQRLIEDLLNFNLARSEHDAFLASPIFIDKLIRELIADHRPAMIAKGLIINLALMRVTLRGDIKKLKIIIDNLLSNAVKFSPKGGTLLIRLERSAQNVIIEFEDDGPGIEIAEREKIFEAFYQGQHAGGGHLKGTGIGLSIAREYVHAHNGHIEVLTPRERTGACLRVTLPIGINI